MELRKILEIFICVVNRIGWSQDRQGSQVGLHNLLPAWPWALEEVGAASGSTVLHRWGAAPSLPCHTTYANSAKQLSYPPSVYTKVLPLVSHSSVTLKQMIGAKKCRDPSGSVLLFFPKTTCIFFHSVKLREKLFWVIFNLLLIYFFHCLAHPNFRVHPAKTNQNISKCVKHFSRWWFFLLKMLPRGSLSFLPCLIHTPLTAEPQL